MEILEKKIAYLEFVNDQLSSEIVYIDDLLKKIGFEGGLATIKCVAEEVIEEGS
ncbi:MAG: hypothetical protein KDK55_05325 [Chlamydiia bacterium]|nr:hypothetical protein [Chlamydiia bacterium]